MENSMSNQIFDLEQQIVECWNVINDIETVTKWFADDPAWKDLDPKVCDAIMNKYFAIQELYELKFQKTWDTFEKVCSEYHSNRRDLEQMSKDWKTWAQ